MNDQSPTDDFIVHALLSTGKRVDYSFPSSVTANDLTARIISDPNIEKPDGKIISLIHQGKQIALNVSLKSLSKNNENEIMLHVFFRIPPETENEKSEQSNIPLDNLQGFDRLSSMNYTSQEIENIRRNFHHIQGTENSPHDQQISLEEEWFPTIFNQENPLDIFRTVRQPIIVQHQAPTFQGLPGYPGNIHTQIQPNSTRERENDDNNPESSKNLILFFFGLLIGLFGFFGLSFICTIDFSEIFNLFHFLGFLIVPLLFYLFV